MFINSFYYEQQVNRELERIHILGCRYNERPKPKTDGSTRLVYTGDKDLNFLRILGFKDLSKMRSQYAMFVDTVGSKQATQ